MDSGRNKPAELRIVLEHYGGVFPNGTGQRPMSCPFHGKDRHKSGSVNTATGVFCCFTCEVAGDAVAIIRDQEGLEYRDAFLRLQEFAEQAGQRFNLDPNGGGLSGGAGNPGRVGAKVPSRWRAR